MSGLRVLAFGAWDRGEGYPRGSALLEGLRSCGVQVTECHIDSPYSGSDKQRLLRSPWLWPGYWWAMRRVKRLALRRLAAVIREEVPDVVLVPYPGHLAVHWIRKVWDGPIVLDMFLSAYDTAVVDRQMFRPGSMMAQLMVRLDRRAVRAADAVLFDTVQNAAHIAVLAGLPREKCHVVPVSDPNEPVTPPIYRAPKHGEILEVLFFGTGVPLHGLGFLLDALEVCEGVRLTLVGGTEADRRHAQSMPPHKVRLADEFLPASELRDYIARTHLVAGVFGTSEKAGRVVPLKVMMALAAGRPVLTGRTPAIRRLLDDGVECVTVPVGDCGALGRELQRLAGAPHELCELAAAGRLAYQREFALRCVGQRLRRICVDLAGVADLAAPAAAAGAVTGSKTHMEPVG